MVSVDNIEKNGKEYVQENEQKILVMNWWLDKWFRWRGWVLASFGILGSGFQDRGGRIYTLDPLFQ